MPRLKTYRKRGFNIIDMVGQRSEKLTVIKRGPNKADGSAQWLCQCDCGNPKLSLLTGRNLRAHTTKSCGCLAEEHRAWISANHKTLLADYFNRGTPMAKCHPELPQEAKGLCGPCYSKLKQTYNPERDKAMAAARRTKVGNRYQDPDSNARKRHLKHLYKITVEDYERMWSEQGGVCAICKKPETATWRTTDLIKRLHVDHDHGCCPGKRSCGKCIRGLLCGVCNMISGLAKDNPELLERIAQYLRAGGFTGMKSLEAQIEACVPSGC